MGKKLAIISFILGAIIAGAGVYFVQSAHMRTVMEAQTKKFEGEKLQADLKISNLQYEFANLKQAYDATQAPQTADPKVTDDGSFFGAIIGYGSDDDVTFTIEFDSMQWSSVTDGTCTNLYPPPQGIPVCPNSVSGENTEVQVDTLELANSASIRVNKFNDQCESGDSEIIDITSFVHSLFQASECGQGYYNIIMKDGLVTSVIQQNLP